MAALVNVVLVHGTHSHSDWIEPSSDMSIALGKADCQSECFPWSGDNSHHARIVEAERLALFLSDPSRSALPQAIVAHSHGGNLALHALARLGKTADEIPVATLATPFIVATRKLTYGPSLFWGSLTIVGALAVVIWAAVDFRQWDGAWWLTVALAIAGVLAAVLLMSAVYLVIRRGPIWRHDAQDEFLATLDAPEVQSGLLVVRAPGDEASGLLAVGQFTGWLSAFLLSDTRPSTWPKVVGLLGVTGLVVDRVFGSRSGDVLGTFAGAVIIGFCLVSFLALSVPAFLALAYGIDGPATSLFGVVTSEVTPPGSTPVKQVRPRPEQDPKQKVHSSLYENPEVIKWVVEHVLTAAHRPDDVR